MKDQPIFIFEVEFCGGLGDQTWDNTIKITSSNMECALWKAQEMLKDEPCSIVRIEQVD